MNANTTLHTLAIDLGGTLTKLALFTKDFDPVEEIEIPTLSHLGPEAALIRWAESTAQWLKKYQVDLIGIGSPGPLDSMQGVILETPNLKSWNGFPLAATLGKKLGLPCFLENDANCSALGEWSRNRISDLIVVTLGTGVGVGIIGNNQLVRGTRGFASQGGHMVIDTHGPPCACGRRGCWEAFCGGSAVVNRYNEKSPSPIPKLTPQEIFNRARMGESLAGEVIRDWTFALAVGIGNLINVFNPEQVILTGGISRSFSFLESAFKEILLTQAFQHSLECVEVVVSQLQNKAGLMGAALRAQQQV